MSKTCSECMPNWIGYSRVVLLCHKHAAVEALVKALEKFAYPEQRHCTVEDIAAAQKLLARLKETQK